MTVSNNVCFIFLFVMLLQSCVPPTGTDTDNVDVDLQNPDIQSLYKLKNEGEADSLYALFDNPSPTIRYLAIQSFASTKEEGAIDKIVEKLSDPILEVRAAAAFALGQIGDPDSEDDLIGAFVSQDTLAVDNIFNANVLEALGKLALEKTAFNISSVKSYRDTDSTLLLGQMRSIYRFGLRDVLLPESVNASLTVLQGSVINSKAKIYAAHFIGRSKVELTSDDLDKLVLIYDQEQDPNIRMALANGLSKLSTTSGPGYIYDNLATEEDYRVKCNLIRSLGRIEGGMIFIDSIVGLLTNENLHVANSAVDYISKLENVRKLPLLRRALVQPNLHWNVKAKVYEKLLSLTPLRLSRTKRIISDSIMANILRSNNVYEQRTYVNAMGGDVFNFQRLLDFDPSEKVLKTAKVDALAKIIKNENFNAIYRRNAINIKKTIVNHIADMCVGGNAGVISAASYILAEPATLTKELIEDSLWINKVYDGMTLPKDLEAFTEFSKVEKIMTGEQREADVSGFYKSIDYNVYNQVSDSSIVVLKTTKGNITIKLEHNIAPTTVSSFVKLCMEDYYDDKVFHRVVPNFVVQVGCPDGDGYGSGDFLLRSEFSQLNYDQEGLVGMASIGPDTESNQFFITHSPAPHLDGKYTIFGRVIDGMDVVHDLHVGDKIIDAILTK